MEPLIGGSLVLFDLLGILGIGGYILDRLNLRYLHRLDCPGFLDDCLGDGCINLLSTFSDKSLSHCSAGRYHIDILSPVGLPSGVGDWPDFGVGHSVVGPSVAKSHIVGTSRLVGVAGGSPSDEGIGYRDGRGGPVGSDDCAGAHILGCRGVGGGAVGVDNGGAMI